jgi:hypothetical protein
LSNLTVNRYRLYCNTESAYVYTWNTTVPTVCPNNNTHSIDTTTITVIDSASNSNVNLTNVLQDPFQRLEVVTKTPVFEIKSIFGKSALRDIFTTTGSALITNVIGTDAEYNLNVTGSSDGATLTTAQRGVYISGSSCEVGFGVRLPASVTGNQVITWGLTDGTDGYYFKLTSSGLSVNTLRNGVETSIARSNWNIDKFDGTGISGVNLDLTKGNIFRILFTWYGYGLIDFGIVSTDSTHTQKVFSIHRMQPQAQTSTKTPNLPIKVSVLNNGTVATSNVYVAGRQYSVFGLPSPTFRLNGAYVYNVPVANGSFSHALTITKKSGFLGCSCNPTNLFASATADSLIEIRTGTTLTGGSFVGIQDQDPNETAVQMNTTATGVSGGVVIWLGILIIGGNGSNTNSLTQTFSDLNYEIVEQTNLTVMVKGLNGTANASITLRWREEW